MHVQILTLNESYHCVTKGISTPPDTKKKIKKTTEIEIVCANFSGSQMGDLITIVCTLI